MGDVTVETVEPEAIEQERIAGDDTLVLGAPHIGKSHQLEQCVSDASAIRMVERLVEPGWGETVVIDEFDRAWRTAAESDRETLIERLDGSGGVCAVTRPSALEWLLEEGTAFTAGHVEAFDRVLVLKYDHDPDKEGLSEDERDATETCLDIANDPESDDDALTEDDLRDRLGLLGYHHEFDDDLLPEGMELGTYGPTVVPALVGYISLADVDEGLLAGGVRDTLTSLPEELTLSGFTSGTLDLVGDVLSQVTDDPASLIPGGLPRDIDPAEVGAAAATSVPFGGAVSLLLWAYLRDDEDGPSEDAILGTLAGAGTTPTARAEMEARLGLPPRTLDDLHWLLQGGNVSRIRETIEDSPAREEFRERMREHEAQLDEFTSRIEQLDDRVEKFTGLYSQHLRNAVTDLNAVGGKLASNEGTLLSPLVDEDEIEIEQVPYFDPDVEEPEDDEDGADDEDETPSKVETVVSAVHDEEMVILRGPAGTGKTTAAYRVGRLLEQEGWAVRTPDLTAQSAGFVSQSLDRFVDEDCLALYVSYRHGLDEATISAEKQFEILREWVQEGVCDCLIVECRSEFYSSFKSEFIDADGRDLRPERIDFDRFDSVWQAIGVVRWVADYVGAEPPSKERMKKLVSLSDANPEILKLAARFEFSDEYTLEDVTTADGIVLKDIEKLFDRGSDENRVLYERLFVLLAVTRGLTTSEIIELLDTDKSDLAQATERVAGYLNRDVASALEGGIPPRDEQTWRLSPDFFTDVTVRKSLDPDQEQSFQWVFNRLFIDERERSYDEHLFDMAVNLGLAYSALRRRTDTGEDKRERMLKLVDAERCTTVTDTFLEQAIRLDIDRSHVVNALYPLANKGVPFDPDVLASNRETLVGCADDVERFNVGAGSLLQTVCGYLYANQLARGCKASDVAEMTVKFAIRCGELHDYEPNQFLSKSYSIAISNLAQSYPDTKMMNDWLDEIKNDVGICVKHINNEYGYKRIVSMEFIEIIYTISIKIIYTKGVPPKVESTWLTEIRNRSQDLGVEYEQKGSKSNTDELVPANIDEVEVPVSPDIKLKPTDSYGTEQTEIGEDIDYKTALGEDFNYKI